MKIIKKSILPGNKEKQCYRDLIKSLPIKGTEIVEGFLGSGALAQTIKDTHHHKTVIGAEKFKPLRAYYESEINLKQVHANFCKAVLVNNLLDKSALDDVWQYCRDVISSREPKKVLFSLSEAEALAILLECSYSHSIRFSANGHNVSVDLEKAKAAVKNGFRNPVVIRPDRVLADWSEAIVSSTNPATAIFTSDPPYHLASQVYCHDRPKACGLPPIQLAMEIGYGQILAFNNFEPFFDQDISNLAKKWGYSLTSDSTNRKYQINNKQKNIKKPSQISLFSGEDPLNNLPSGEWWWFLSKSI